MAKRIPCQGKHREFGNLTKTRKTQEILFSQVLDFLILKIQEIALFEKYNFNFFPETL